LLLPLLPNPEEEIDLYHPFIPPKPDFLKRRSALMTLREKMTISKTNSAIGNGKIKDSKNAKPK